MIEDSATKPGSGQIWQIHNAVAVDMHTANLIQNTDHKDVHTATRTATH